MLAHFPYVYIFSFNTIIVPFLLPNLVLPSLYRNVYVSVCLCVCECECVCACKLCVCMCLQVHETASTIVFSTNILVQT